MLTLILISSFIVLFGIYVLILTAHNKEHFYNLRVVIIIIAIAFCFFGLILLPSLVTDHTEVTQLENCKIIKADNCIILDVSNTKNESAFDNNLIKFSSYDIVSSFSDSTKFYINIQKSFYNINLFSYYTWSKPPYNIFYKE